MSEWLKKADSWHGRNRGEGGWDSICEGGKGPGPQARGTVHCDSFCRDDSWEMLLEQMIRISL